MNYTKGEWKVLTETHNSGLVFCNGWIIASVGASSDLNDDEFRTTKHINAHLIAASPDMYEALKKCLALLDKQREEYNSALSLLPRQEVGEGEIARESRKALNKAEGK